MRSFQLACVGSQTSMPIPSEYERAALSFSAVTPGPTSSLTRHMSAAAVTGFGASTAISSSPFFTERTATTVVSASGRKAALMPSSHASGSANADVSGPQAATSSAATQQLAAIFVMAFMISIPCIWLKFHSGTRHGHWTGFACLCGEADRGVGGAEPLIIAALDDLEEEPFVENVGVDLEEFAVAFAVVEYLVVAKGFHRRRVEIVFGFDVVVVIVWNSQEVRAACAHIRNRREDVGARKRDMLDAGAKKFMDEAGRQRPRGRRTVEDHPQALIAVDQRLALHKASRIGDLLLRQPLQIEDPRVEQQPRQHLVIGHRLRDVINRGEAVGRRVAGQRFEIGLPVLAVLFPKIEQAAADAADRGNFQFARPDRLIEGARLQGFGTRHGGADVVDVDRDGANAGAVGDEVRMGKAVRLAIDDELDIALRPALDVLAAVGAGLAKTELAEQRRQIFRLGLVGRELDEANAAASRLRLQPGGRRGLGLTKLILQ